MRGVARYYIAHNVEELKLWKKENAGNYIAVNVDIWLSRRWTGKKSDEKVQLVNVIVIVTKYATRQHTYYLYSTL